MQPKDNKGNKRKSAGPTKTTQPKRRKPEQKHEPSRAVESSGDQPSPSSQVPGPSQSPAGQPRSEDGNVCMNVLQMFLNKVIPCQ